MACARRSSIFQDALGDSDGNKKYFRFSGISRTSPNDLIAVLEREHTAGTKPTQLPKRKVALTFQSYPYQEKKTLPKLLLHVSRCRFVADFAPPFLYNPTPGARILTSFSFTGIKNPIQQTRFFFPILLIFFFLTVFRSQFRIDSLLSYQNSQQTLTHFSPHGSKNNHSHMCICY